MATESERRHSARRRPFHRSHQLAEEFWWEPHHRYGPGYEYEEELSDQIAKLPLPDQVEEVFMHLRVQTLRQLSAEIVNVGVEYIRANADRLEQARFVNSCFATAEETVAAGRNVSRIASRRRKKA